MARTVSETPPPVVLNFHGTHMTEVTPSEATKALDLPDTLLIPSGAYRFHGRAYAIEQEGLYRFLAPMVENRQHIVFRREPWALLSDLCWLHSHGSRDDGLTPKEWMALAMRRLARS